MSKGAKNSANQIVKDFIPRPKNGDAVIIEEIIDICMRTDVLASALRRIRDHEAGSIDMENIKALARFALADSKEDIMAFLKKVQEPDLSKLSDEALEAELKARKLKQQAPPSPLASPDWSKLTKYVTKTVERLAKSEDEYEKDFDQRIFESVMTTIYGKDFWTWWNKGPGNRD